MQKNQEDCVRCGTCCTSGGPALHSEDKHLISEGGLPRAQLITIRKGELAHNPLTNSLQPIKKELVKVSGAGRQWNCCFFDPEDKGCTIYDKRPRACKALKCWDTKDIETLIETDTLCRLDLLESDDPLRPFVEEHEKLFPCPEMKVYFGKEVPKEVGGLEALVNSEIAYRTKVVARFDLSLGEELFYFGRPIFHILASIGAEVDEVGDHLTIKWPDVP